MGAIDPVQMTQQAPYQETLYVSGWACSSVLTSTNEVSPDLGDYPYNTVPNQVQRLFKAQQLHERRHWDERRGMSQEQRKVTPWVDYLRPIIADGDTGWVSCLFLKSFDTGVPVEVLGGWVTDWCIKQPRWSLICNEARQTLC